MAQDTRVTAKLHGGPHDGDRLVVPHALVRIHLSLWEGPFLSDCATATYRLRPRWNGGPEADYDFDDPDPEAAPAVVAAAVPTVVVSGDRRRVMRVLGLAALAAVWYRQWIAGELRDCGVVLGYVLRRR